MEIKCEFTYIDFDVRRYTCQMFAVNINEKNNVIKEFKGVHEKGKSHKDVEAVYFCETTKVNYFPRGLEKHFPNITVLVINGGGIKEISKNDLKGLEGLFRLRIVKCKLSSLPDDLFTEMPNLHEVSFYGNEIKIVSSEVLKPLIERKDIRVNLRGNKNIDAVYWPSLLSSLKPIEELAKFMDENFIKPTLPTVVPKPAKSDLMIKEMWLSGKFSDLTISAGETKFKVHKNILGMQSKVFAQIFEDQHEATEIKIPDFSANSAEALLKFIYTNEASEDGNAKENFDIADKFKVDEMKSFYEKIIGEKINEENVWETFLFAHRFSSQLLKEKTFRLIMKKIPEDLPDKLMEDPEKLKIMIDARQVYEEVVAKLKLEL